MEKVYVSREWIEFQALLAYRYIWACWLQQKVREEMESTEPREPA